MSKRDSRFPLHIMIYILQGTKMNGMPSKTSKKCWNQQAASEQGSLLVVVLVLMMVMSIFALSVGYTVRQRIGVLGRLEIRQKLRLIADASIKTGLAEIDKSAGAKGGGADARNQSWSHNAEGFHEVVVGDGLFSLQYEDLEGIEERLTDEPKFRYGLVDEESKVNLNETKKIGILEEIFYLSAGLEKGDARTLAACVIDWIDEDDELVDINSEESRFYRFMSPPYEPKNAPVEILEELLFVKGMSPEILNKIRPYVTVHSSGHINVNTAGREVLLAVGMPLSLVNKILVFRRGADGDWGTTDDGIFSSLPISGAFGAKSSLSPREVSMLQTLEEEKLLGVNSEYFSAQSVSKLKQGTQALKVNAVINRQGGILTWREKYFALAAS